MRFLQSKQQTRAARPMAGALIVALLSLSVGWLPAQTSGSSAAAGRGAVAGVTVKGPVVAKRGQTVTVPVQVKVADGHHVTSANPGDRYLKPLRLTWDKGAALLPDAPRYPEAVQRSYPFSEGKLSVLEGTFVIQQGFRVPSGAAQGFGAVIGKLSYQACTDRECFAPATVPVRFSYDIR